MNEVAEHSARDSGQRIPAKLDAKIIDLMFAHVPANTVESAYNRAAFMDRRIEIPQNWADLLCEGPAEPANLLEGSRR